MRIPRFAKLQNALIRKPSEKNSPMKRRPEPSRSLQSIGAVVTIRDLSNGGRHIHHKATGVPCNSAN
jgi:hypothetical protein